MATTLDDARIVLKLDFTQAEQAAEEYLRKRKARGGGRGGGGGGPPGGGGPSPADHPDPRDGGPGYGAQALGALASGNVAGIPGLNIAVGLVGTAFKLEAMQAVAAGFAGFFNNPTDAELRANWVKAEGFKEHLIAMRDAFEAGMHDMFAALQDGITILENKARMALAAVAAANEGVEFVQAQAVMGEFEGFGPAFKIVGIRAQMGEAASQLSEARQKVSREMMGAAVRGKADEFRDKLFSDLVRAFGKD